MTLRIVRGLFSCAVSIYRFLRTFVSFSVFRTVVPAVCLSSYPGNFSGIPLLFCGEDL